MAGGTVGAAVGLAVAAAGGQLEPTRSAWRLVDVYVASLIAMATIFFASEWKPLRRGLANATRLEPTTVPSTPPFRVQRIAALALVMAILVAAGGVWPTDDHWMIAGTCLAVTLGGALGECLLPLRAVAHRERAQGRRFYRVDTDDGEVVGYAWEPATSPSRR
jgi:hypothetical protein